MSLRSVELQCSEFEGIRVQGHLVLCRSVGGF